MIYIKYEGHDYKYDLDNILNIFIDKENLSFENLDDTSFTCDDYILENKLVNTDEEVFISTVLYKNADGEKSNISKDTRKIFTKNKDKIELKKIIKREIKLSIYETLIEEFESRSKWGILVGIRPVKIVHEILDKGKNYKEVIKQLEELKVSREKIDLLISIAKRERNKIYPLKDEISLYISIPFCPSRCYYCSFPSNDINKGKYKIEDYIKVLEKEIVEIGKLKRELNLNIDCIYFGGGTPSILSESQLEYLMNLLDKNIGTRNLKEFTFEAGRADTITKEKLNILKKNRVNRICVNPQTFNDKTLKVINRKHTIEDFYRAYEMVKEYNFKSVNFDLILGLKGENFLDMKYSIDEALRLGPENITVHTLAVKRSSKLNEVYNDNLVGNVEDVEKGLLYSSNIMLKEKYYPYYMYRQKRMVGNFENVGYSKDGFESLYNMRIMEERHTIIAIGAGSTSKICYEKENRFERHANPKGLDVYLSNIDKYLEKHIQIIRDRY